MSIYRLPQEIEVWYVIPAVRKELARLLTKKHGLSYDKAATALGITKDAISQYNNNKRAGKVRLHKTLISEIDKASDRIRKDKDKTVKEILKILKFMRDKKLPFEYCKGGTHNHEECKEILVTYGKYWGN